MKNIIRGIEYHCQTHGSLTAAEVDEWDLCTLCQTDARPCDTSAQDRQRLLARQQQDQLQGVEAYKAQRRLEREKLLEVLGAEVIATCDDPECNRKITRAEYEEQGHWFCPECNGHVETLFRM